MSLRAIRQDLWLKGFLVGIGRLHWSALICYQAYIYNSTTGLDNTFGHWVGLYGFQEYEELHEEIYMTLRGSRYPQVKTKYAY